MKYRDEILGDIAHAESPHDLDDFELELLRAMAGKRPAFEWGAAVGASLETLKSRRLIEKRDGQYVLTDAGRAIADS